MDGYWKNFNCIKDIQKGNLVSSFRLITYLPLTWKLLTDILAEELYKHLEQTNSLPYHGNKRDAGKEAETEKINY